jgi:hypothetical protein
LSGTIPESLAAEEQPKFTAYSESRSAHVIVKFSSKGTNEIARRWKDILITEHHTAKILHERGFLAAETHLSNSDGRLFLESIRFDRSGEHGRKSMISLQSIDTEFSGPASSWPQLFSALYKQELVCEQQMIDAECLWCFGRLLYNSDMHLGNLNLAIGGKRFRLLPIYDMCSMGFAPRGGSKVRPYDFVATMPRISNIDTKRLRTITDMARGFWGRVAEDERISDDFRVFLREGNPVTKMLAINKQDSR